MFLDGYVARAPFRATFAVARRHIRVHNGPRSATAVHQPIAAKLLTGTKRHCPF